MANFRNLNGENGEINETWINIEIGERAKKRFRGIPICLYVQ